MLTIDQVNCIGCGLCASLCPDNFKINDDFKAEIINAGQIKPCVQEAVDNCPVQAIKK
jgi:ferredoxin